MDFKTRKIEKDAGRIFGKAKKISIKKLIWAVFAIAIIFYGVKFFVSGSNLKEFIFSFGTPLQTDKSGYTNLIFMGTGGELHEGADLTDSIMVASLDADNNAATLLSIPRDLYVDTKIDGKDRINKIYTLAKNKLQDSEAGLEIMKEVAADITGTEIHYYIKMNFEGFAEIIDNIGGVDIYVEEAIDDPFYPKEGTILYEPFHLPKGLQHLNGETALKYVRSRKTTSDFDRSQRQQKILSAIKDKVAKKGILSDPDQIKDIFFSLKDNIETDLSLREIIKLSEIVKKITNESIKTYILHDDPSQCGGFLYTPQRDLYGGAFVLIPASDPYNPDDNYKYLHFFTKEIFSKPEIGKENIEIQVLNGTGTPGLAGGTKVLLKRHCLNVKRFGNAKDLEVQTTKIYAKTETALNSKTIQVIQDFLGTGEISANPPPEYLEKPYISNADIIIELGKDYANSANIDPFDYLVDIETYENKNEEENKNNGESTEATKSEK